MSVLQAVSALLPLGIAIAAEESSSHAARRETFAERFRRVSDELLWPRILIRNVPPQG